MNKNKTHNLIEKFKTEYSNVRHNKKKFETKFWISLKQ
jgi:hypothetical protein